MIDCAAACTVVGGGGWKVGSGKGEYEGARVQGCFKHKRRVLVLWVQDGEPNAIEQGTYSVIKLHSFNFLVVQTKLQESDKRFGVDDNRV